MDFKKTLANPWVLGGGAALALVLVLSSRGGSSSNGDISAVLGAQAAQNAAGLNYAANAASIAATVQMKNIDTKSAETIGFLSMMQMMFENGEVNATQRAAVSADVVKTRIANDTARHIESMSIFERMSAVWVGADVSRHGIDTNADVAKYGMRTTLDAGLMRDAMAAHASLGQAQAKAGSDALGNILKFAGSII